jgi:O-antigen ligase/tetratricopeptide (TPR) repeat protein
MSSKKQTRTVRNGHDQSAKQGKGVPLPLWWRMMAISLCGALLLAPWWGGSFYIGPQPVENWFADWLSGRQMPLFGGAVLALGVLAAFAAGTWGAEIWRFPVGRIFLPLLLLLGWFMLLMLQTNFQWHAVHKFAEWLTAALLFFVIVAIVRRGSLAWMALGSLIAGASLVALYALQDYAIQLKLGNPSWRVFSTFFNPNFLAGYLAMIIPLTWGVLLWVSRNRDAHQHGRSWLILLTASAWLQMIALMLTASRAGFAAMAIGLFVWFIAMFIQRLLTWASVILLVVSGMILLAGGLWIARPAVERLTPQAARQEIYSADFRQETWKGTLNMIRQNPLMGTGLGSYEWTYPRYAHTGYTRLAHNSYLELGAEAGVPVFVFLLWFGFSWLGRTMQRERHDAPAHDWRPVQVGIVGGALASVIHNLWDSDLASFGILLTLFALLGLGVALAVDGITPMPVARLTRRMFGLGLSLLLGYYFLSVGLGEIYANTARQQLLSGQLLQGIEGYEAALRGDRRNPDYMLELADARSVYGQPDKALALYHQSLESKPSPRTYYRLGLFYERTGQVEEAKQNFLKALEADPNNLTTLLKLARLAETSQPQEAIKYYLDIVALEQTPYGQVRAVPELVETAYAFANLKVGELKEKENNKQEAEEHYRRALALFEEYRSKTLPFNQAAKAIGHYHPEREREIAMGHAETLRHLIELLGKSASPEELEKWQQQRDEILMQQF